MNMITTIRDPHQNNEQNEKPLSGETRTQKHLKEATAFPAGVEPSFHSSKFSKKKSNRTGVSFNWDNTSAMSSKKQRSPREKPKKVPSSSEKDSNEVTQRIEATLKKIMQDMVNKSDNQKGAQDSVRSFDAKPTYFEKMPEDLESSNFSLYLFF